MHNSYLVASLSLLALIKCNYCLNFTLIIKSKRNLLTMITIKSCLVNTLVQTKSLDNFYNSYNSAKETIFKNVQNFTNKNIVPENAFNCKIQTRQSLFIAIY